MRTLAFFSCSPFDLCPMFTHKQPILLFFFLLSVVFSSPLVPRRKLLSIAFRSASTLSPWRYTDSFSFSFSCLLHPSLVVTCPWMMSRSIPRTSWRIFVEIQKMCSTTCLLHGWKWVASSFFLFFLHHRILWCRIRTYVQSLVRRRSAGWDEKTSEV